MAIITRYSLAESAAKIIHGGDIGVASDPSINALKIAVGQVLNKLLKTDLLQMNVNRDMAERIPNGCVLGMYENIAVQSYNGKSVATLPIKPMKLPRNMGVWAIYSKWEANGDYDLDKEFIPLQMGQGGLLKSQRLISDLLGQVGYEVFGDKVIFTKDLKSISQDVVVAMRLMILDIDLYDDWDLLPIPPEMEYDAINAVVQMYKQQGIPDKTVDPSTNEQNDVPITQQRMA
jgi:hypothetical protein